MMMLKLYKTNGSEVQYWEAWDDRKSLTIHRGRLGDTGTTATVRLRRGEKPDSAIEREARACREQGYNEIPLDQHAQIIVQYRTTDWGSNADLHKRNQVESVLNECLGWTGNGHCDGGDIGSGTINTFSFVVDPQLAVKAIVPALRKAQLLDGAVIALENEDSFEVLWPKNHREEFRYWYGA